MASEYGDSDLDELFNGSLPDEVEETDMDDLFNEAFLDEEPQAEASAKAQPPPLTFPTPAPLTFPTPPPLTFPVPSLASGSRSPLTFPTPPSQSPHQLATAGGPLLFSAPAAHPHARVQGQRGQSSALSSQSCPPPPYAPSTTHQPVVRNVPPASAQSPPLSAGSPNAAVTPGETGEGGERLKRKNKPRVNWTDEESERLLKGVEAYGIGCWAKIRSDPQFKLEHRKNVDLKDRFRTIFPNEYKMHCQKAKTKTTSGLVDSPTPDPPSYTNGTSPENPVFLELDYQAARLQKKLNRKRCVGRKSDSRPRVVPPPRLNPEEDPELTTATGRRRVTRRHDVPWTAEEDADLQVAFNRYKRRFRLAAGDRRYAFFGRTISDIQKRFTRLHPGLLLSLAEDEEPLNSFEQGLVNDFGTTGASQRQARKRASAPKKRKNKSSKSSEPSTASHPVPPLSEEVTSPAGGGHPHTAMEAADTTLLAQDVMDAPEVASYDPEPDQTAPSGPPAPSNLDFLSAGNGHPPLSIDTRVAIQTQGAQVHVAQDAFTSSIPPTPHTATTNRTLNTSNTSFASAAPPSAGLGTPCLSYSGDTSPTSLDLPTPGAVAGSGAYTGGSFNLPYAGMPDYSVDPRLMVNPSFDPMMVPAVDPMTNAAFPIDTYNPLQHYNVQDPMSVTTDFTTTDPGTWYENILDPGAWYANRANPAFYLQDFSMAAPPFFPGEISMGDQTFIPGSASMTEQMLVPTNTSAAEQMPAVQAPTMIDSGATFDPTFVQSGDLTNFMGTGAGWECDYEDILMDFAEQDGAGNL
ncbi:hypothetical protein Dda_0290 [Drechslerella dactyloides]|uniref:Myb-like domain-containing protein n=1 Tax=Drechslerella dactyloides TaxID=74499 RepID=A0AAD6J417_DREDA|nr:hypothetical protein Dda_0290 [Drechslerella dactyloides]